MIYVDLVLRWWLPSILSVTRGYEASELIIYTLTVATAVAAASFLFGRHWEFGKQSRVIADLKNEITLLKAQNPEKNSTSPQQIIFISSPQPLNDFGNIYSSPKEATASKPLPTESLKQKDSGSSSARKKKR